MFSILSFNNLSVNFISSSYQRYINNEKQLVKGTEQKQLNNSAFLMIKREMCNVCNDVHQNVCTSKCSVKILYRSIKWYIGVFSSHKQDHQLRISSSAETKYFYSIFVVVFGWCIWLLKQHIMTLAVFDTNTSCIWLLSLIIHFHLPAWFPVVEIEVHYMTIRAPS